MKSSMALAAVSVISAGLLSGCLSDDYDYSQDEPPVPDVKVFSIYGDSGSDNFLMQIEDRSGGTVEVDPEGIATLEGMSVRPVVPGTANGALRVTINDGASGIIRTQGVAPQDLTTYTPSGTLQFDLKVLSKNADVVVTLGSVSESSSTQRATVDLTSVVRAYAGGDTQKVKIPMSCFSDQGVDFAHSLVPLELQSSDGISFEVGNIQVASNTADSTDVISCSVTAEDLNDGNTSDIFVVNSPNNWAPSLVTWLTDGSDLQLDWGADNFAVNYAGVEAGVNGGALLQTPDNGSVRRDISRYIEQGELRFMLNVENYGDHPTKRLQVQMESQVPAGDEQYATVASNPYLLDAWFADNQWQQVRIPLKSLFTSEDGQINVNAIQNVNKPFSILPEWFEEEDSLNGMLYRIASVQLVIP